MKKFAVVALLAACLCSGVFATTNTFSAGQCTWIQSTPTAADGQPYDGALFFTINNGNIINHFYIPLTDPRYETFLSLLITSRTKGYNIDGAYFDDNIFNVGGTSWYRAFYLDLN